MSLDPASVLIRPEEIDTVELDRHFLEIVRNGVDTREALETLLDRLRQSSSEWRATVDALDALIFLVAADGRILRTNLALEHWGLGSVREVEGRELHEVLHPNCNAETCHLVSAWRAFLGREASRSETSGSPSEPRVEEEIEDPTLGRTIELTLRRVEPAGETDPDRSFAVVVVRDVTEIARERLRRRHREQSETMTYLIRGLAHEIGNPLAAMKTSLQVLGRHLETFSPEKRLAYVERALEGTDRIWSIVSRILHGHSWHIDRLAPLRLDQVCRRLHDMLVDEATQRGVELRVRVAGEAGVDAPEVRILGDLTAAEEVLANVVRNALDACEPGGCVEVEGVRRGDVVVISVRDDGHGMSPEDLARIFQPFFTTKNAGSGIGMTHVAHLMHEMDGSVEIDSVEGEGTRVDLTFRAVERRGGKDGD